MSGSIVSKLIGILFIPIIARLYLPEDFGTSQIFFSLISILVIVSCFSYQFAIMLPEDENDSLHLFILCLMIILIFSIFVFILIFLFSNQIIHLLKIPQLSGYMYLIPLAILVGGIAEALNYWIGRKKKFGLIASAQVLGNLGDRGSQFFIGYLIKASPFGLIFGSIFQSFIFIGIMLKTIKKDIKIKYISFNRILFLLKKYKKFPIFNTWSNMINVIAWELPSFMLNFFFNSMVVGFYSLGNTIINVSLGLIGRSVGQVFFQKASEEQSKTGSIKTIVFEVYKRLVSIGIFPFLILMIVGKDLFILVFGNQWGEAGIYIQILSPWLFFVLISSPLSTIFSVIEKQEMVLKFNIILLFSRLTALYIGGVYGDPIIAFALFSISGIILYSWLNSMLLISSGISPNDGFKIILKFLLYSTPFVVVILLTKFLTHNLVVILFITVIMTILYYLIILSKDEYLKEELYSIIQTFTYS